MTIYRILETDGVPAPSDIELAALDRRRADITPMSRVCFNYYCRFRNINGERPNFHQFLVEEDRAGAVLTIKQWDDLLIIFDAHDERETQADARNAGCR